MIRYSGNRMPLSSDVADLPEFFQTLLKIWLIKLKGIS